MRPADWSAVGLATDPVPGDPAVVAAGGRDYLDIAGTIGTTASRLRSLGMDTQISEAVHALADTAAAVADDISKAEKRYRETGEALLDYAPTLASAQADSLDALLRASAARSAGDEARSRQHRYLRLAETETDPAQSVQYTDLGARFADEVAAADAGLDAAVQQIAAAQHSRDRAAQSARDRITNTTSHDNLNDSWWDDWGKQVLSVITDVAGMVAGIAGVLALVVSWIPVVGQVLAAALLLVAGVAAIVNAIGNIVLASTGDRTWGEAIASIVVAALSVVGLGAAARLVGAASSAARISAAARLESGWAGESLTVRQALRIKPGAMRESEQLWRTPVTGPKNGDGTYRVWGGGSGSGGGSWSGADPRSLANPRSSLGLPDVNSMENLSIGRITDASEALHTRHALPLDGMPGGAPEWVFRPGSPTDPSIGRVVDQTVPFTLPPR